MLVTALVVVEAPTVTTQISELPAPGAFIFMDHDDFPEVPVLPLAVWTRTTAACALPPMRQNRQMAKPKHQAENFARNDPAGLPLANTFAHNGCAESPITRWFWITKCILSQIRFAYRQYTAPEGVIQPPPVMTLIPDIWHIARAIKARVPGGKRPPHW